MALYALITQIVTSISGTQTSGNVSISIYDALTNLPTNGNNCQVSYTQNIDGAVTTSTVIIPGLSYPIYSGVLNDTSEGTPFFTKFQINSLVPGNGTTNDPAADDLTIVNVITTPESAIGASDGTVTINATSSFPAIQYSLDNVTWQSGNVFTGQHSGNGIAYVEDTNSGTAQKPYTVNLLGSLLTQDPTVDLGNGNLSRWNAAFNNVWFKFQRKDFEITSITQNTDGNILVNINADVSQTTARTSYVSTVPSVGTVTSSGDFVYINTAKYVGTYEVLQTNAASLVLNCVWTANDTTGFININSLRPYYNIQTVITYLNPITSQFQTITATNYPLSDGSCQNDISSFLKALLQAKDYSGYYLTNYRDSQLSASYTIQYAEVWNGNTPTWINISRPYYVLFAARQLQQIGGGNMQQFVPFPLGFQPALWVTDFQMPVYNYNFPFDIGFIYSEYMVNLNPYYRITLLDINQNELASQTIDDSYLINTDGSFILNQDGSKFIIAGQNLVDVPIVQQVGLNRLLINFVPPSDCYYFNVQLLYKQSTTVFNYSLTEQLTPYFIDGNIQIKINGIDVKDVYSAETGSIIVPVGSTYSIEAYSQSTSSASNPKIRLTVVKVSTTIFDSQIVQTNTASIIKSGIVQLGDVYTITCVTLSTTSSVTPIDIADTNPVSNTEFPLTVSQTIRIDQNTTDRQVYLRWIGLTGCWNYYTFVYNQVKTLEVTNEVSIKNYITNWATTDTIGDVISKNANMKMQVFAENISVEDIEGLQAIKYSPKVQIYIGPIVSGQQWQTVDTGTGTYTESETYIDQYSFSLTFTLPMINIQFQ